jgi:hypothetical protein
MHILVAFLHAILRLEIVRFKQPDKEHLEHITNNGSRGTVVHSVPKVLIIARSSTPFVVSRGFEAEVFGSTFLMEPETIPLICLGKPRIA